MRRFKAYAFPCALMLTCLCSLLLPGCGSDGEDGQPGKDGVIGVSIDSTQTLKVNFTGASVEAGVVSVDFILTNANGVAVLGLTKDHDLRFGIAQLTKVTQTSSVSGVTQDSARGFQWQAYINVRKEPGTVPAGVDNLAPSPQFQADVEKASQCDDCLTDNGDGSYRYRYQTNIAQVLEPLPIAFDKDATQRATLELKLSQVTVNAHLDWQPSTGKTEGIQSKEVVAIQACYTCHQKASLALHGDRRLDLANCVSCHTSSSGDPESGNSIEFGHLIHAIHRGKDRISFEPGDNTPIPTPYKIVGYKSKVVDYGKVSFPQKPAADCRACHVQGEGAPFDAALVDADLSNAACIGCHTQTPSPSHSSSDCVACHNATEPYDGTASAQKRHGDVLTAFTLAEAMSVRFSDIGQDEGGKLSFKVQVLDDKGQAVGSEYLDSNSRVIVAWDSDKDFPAYDVAPYGNRRISLDQGSYDANDKSYRLTLQNLNLPADANGKTFELWSALRVCFNQGGYGIDHIVMTRCDSQGIQALEVKEAPLHFVWQEGGMDTKAQAATRRDIIDANKCQGCHSQQIHHYDNGVNCRTCHTSDKPIKESVRNSGKFDVPTSFAFKAHAREGHNLAVNGVQSGTVLHTDCNSCHTQGGIELGRAPQRAWHYPNPDTLDKSGLWVSSDTGACLSCHQPMLNSAAKAHIETYGGILNGSSAADVRNRTAEICSVCHTQDQLKRLHSD